MTQLITPTKDLHLKVGNIDVAVTHPNKIFFPSDGYTKYDLVSYYLKIMPYAFPYIYNRLQSIRRYPDGIEGKSFFYKDIKTGPEWLNTVLVEHGGRQTNYLVCQEPASVIYMINLGAIDLNHWSSSLNKLDYPDFLIFDLDPLDIPFDAVIQVALSAKKVLDRLGINSFVKLSGATGMHIYVPTGACYNNNFVKNLALHLARLINQETSGISSLERMPQKRRGKVYIDYLQNGFGKTIASPYSVRPKPGAPVAAPLYWHELKEGITNQDYNIKNIFQRLEKVGDPFKELLSTKPLDLDRLKI